MRHRYLMRMDVEGVYQVIYLICQLLNVYQAAKFAAIDHDGLDVVHLQNHQLRQVPTQTADGHGTAYLRGHKHLSIIIQL